MSTTPATGLGTILAQLGATADGARGGKARVNETEAQAFLALLSGLRGAGQGAPALDGAARQGTSAASAALPGLSQPGASAAELTRTKVTIAGGLRLFEAEALQAIRAAMAAGEPGQARALLQGAAQVLGAMLGATDAALGTDAVARIAAVLAASQGDAAGQVAVKGGKGGPQDAGAADQADPVTLASAMFGLIAQALGLVLPAGAARAAGGGGETEAADPAAVQGAAGGGRVAQSPLQALAAVMIRAGEDAGAAVADQPGDPQPGAAGASTEQGGKSGVAAHVSGQVSGLAHGLADPFAQLLHAGPGALAPLQAAAGAGLPTAAMAPPSGQDALLVAAGPGPSAPQAQAAAFAGMLGTQIRAAAPSDGMTRIALSPRGLGEIEIDMKRDGSGRLNVVLRAENPMVLAALRNDHIRVSQMFASGGGGPQPVVAFEAFAGRDGQGGKGQDRRAARSGTAAGATDASAAAEADTAASGWQERIGRGALDIRT